MYPKTQKQFIFSMLTAIDFVIIPQISVDQKTFKITDYRNTSGVYYVSSSKDSITLSANKRHYHYRQDIPQNVKTVPCCHKEYLRSYDLYKKGGVDLVPSSAPMRNTEIEDLRKSDLANIFQTIHLKNTSIAFTSTGMSKFTREERLSIGFAIKGLLFKERFSSPLNKQTIQFFSDLGEAGLTDTRLKDLENTIKNLSPVTDKKKIIIGMGNNWPIAIYDNIFKKVLKNYEIKSLEPLALITPGSEEFDIKIFVTDTGFSEDISLLSYSLSTDTLGLSKQEGEKWLEDYMNIEDKSARIIKLKEMHFKMLNEGRIIPIVAIPAFGVSTKKWEMKLSPFSVNYKLWQIRKKN